MKIRRSLASLACVPLLLGILTPVAAMAASSESSSSTYVDQSALDSEMVKNFGVGSEKMFVMDSAASKANGEEVFYPMPIEAEGALFIAPDLAADIGLVPGKVPAKETSDAAKDLLAIKGGKPPQSKRSALTPIANTAAAKGVCSTGFYTPPTGAWGKWGNRACSQIGNAKGRQVYNFQVIYTSDGAACGEGIGYVAKYTKGVFKGVTKKTYGLGCGKSGGRNVPWENAAGYPQFRSKSAYLGFGTFGTWS